ncbi:potassium channel family protein [Spongorhabdus nitratireducens]
MQQAPRFGFSSLLTGMIGIQLLFPYVVHSRFAGYFLGIGLSLLLISSVYIFSHQRRVLITSAALAIPTFGSTWFAQLYPNPVISIFDTATNALFFGYVIAQLIAKVFSTRQVTRDTISGSICVYLLIGYFWTFLYLLCDHIWPQSFEGLSAGVMVSEYNYFYYSFVTLTTLGYGDIVARTPPAQSLAVMEAITGQIYLTVMVARLVGMHISQGISKQEQESAKRTDYTES